MKSSLAGQAHQPRRGRQHDTASWEWVSGGNAARSNQAESTQRATPGKVRWTGPALGQHNDEVYGKVVGLSREEREALRERGVI